MPKYNVSYIIYFNSQVGPAGAILHNLDTDEELAMTYEEIYKIWEEGNIENAYFRTVYRPDYDKKITSIQPKSRGENFLDYKMNARKFYKSKYCNMTPSLKEKLETYFNSHNYNTSCILTYDLANQIRQEVKDGQNQRKVAQKYNISPSSVSNIVNNLIYVTN